MKEVEVKTSKEITAKTIALTNVGCNNLEGQSKLDFTKAINSEEWVRKSDYDEVVKENELLKRHKGLDVVDGEVFSGYVRKSELEKELSEATRE